MAIVQEEISPKKLEKLNEISSNTLNEVREKLSKQRNRVLVVRPTGFGKSYMLANLTSTKNENGENAFKKCLYVYPTNVIMESVLRDYASDDRYQRAREEIKKLPERTYKSTHGMLNDNTDFISYRWFTYRVDDIKNGEYTEKAFRKYLSQYNLIMLDECHSVGANGFKEAWTILEDVIKFSKGKTKIVGVTATPYRLDAEDIFNIFGNKNEISKYTLEDAIKDKLLPQFEYIYVAKNNDTYLDNAIKYANKTREKNGDRPLSEYEIDEISQYNSNYGMVDVLNRTLKLPIKDGEYEPHVGHSNYAKFIVFMSNRTQIHKDATIVTQWFKEAYPTMEIRSNVIITKQGDDSDYIIDGEVKEIMETADIESLHPTENVIDLIYCVDKLTMGYHVDNITGVVLMNETTSAIKYNQQIGRCFSIRSSTTPLIYHIVDDFENNPSLDNLGDSESGKRIDLTDLLPVECMKINDTTGDITKHCKKMITQDYDNKEKIIWLYTTRHMPATIIAQALRIKLDAVVKLLMNNKIDIVDRNDIMKHKELLSKELLEKL